MFITTLPTCKSYRNIEAKIHNRIIIKRSSENNPNEPIHQSPHIIVRNGIYETARAILSEEVYMCCNTILLYYYCY